MRVRSGLELGKCKGTFCAGRWVPLTIAPESAATVRNLRLGYICRNARTVAKGPSRSQVRVRVVMRGWLRVVDRGTFRCIIRTNHTGCNVLFPLRFVFVRQAPTCGF